MATTNRLLYIADDGLVKQLGFDPTAGDWAGGSVGVTVSASAPAFPHNNMLWWDTVTQNLYVQSSGIWIISTNKLSGPTLAQMHAALISFSR